MKTLAEKSTVAIIVGIVGGINLLFIMNTRGIEKLFAMFIFATMVIPATLKLLLYISTPTKPSKPIKATKTATKQKSQPQTIHNKGKKVETNGYSECRNLINAAIKNSLINRDQVLSTLNIINNYLGKYTANYRNFTFENDAHEIYIKLKSSHLTTDNYNQLAQEISDMINMNIKEEV